MLGVANLLALVWLAGATWRSTRKRPRSLPQLFAHAMTSNGKGEVGPKGGGRTSSGQNAVGAGLTLAVSVGVFAYGGLWLDRQFGTKPWLLLLLVLLGISGGMLHLIREVAPEMYPFGAPAKKDEQHSASDGRRAPSADETHADDSHADDATSASISTPSPGPSSTGSRTDAGARISG